MELQTLKQPNSNIVSALQIEADSNPVFKALCQVFSERQRTRQDITMRNLTGIMAERGYNFHRDQYEGCLVFLASLGIGKLDRGARGRISRLTGIRISLQSIGKAALMEGQSLKRFTPAIKFSKLPEIKEPKTAPIAKRYKASVVIQMEGNDLKLSIPGGVLQDQLGEFITNLHKLGR